MAHPRVALLVGLWLVLLACSGHRPAAAPAPPVTVAELPVLGLLPPAPLRPPFQLTSSDGVGLEIQRIHARVAIEDPIAVTQLELTFENPEARTLEGRFTFVVPEGAALSRLAMRIGGQLMEGEVVEKMMARTTFEEFLHQRRDPALLEQGAGNELAVRVFPIGPREKKEIVIAYSELLRPTAPYRLRVAGLPQVAALDVEVFSHGQAVATHRSFEKTPSEDLWVAPAAWSKRDAVGVSDGTRSLVRLRIPEGESARDPLGDVVVLLDTSASRALDLESSIAALQALPPLLSPGAKLRVAAFDQSVVPLYDGPAKGFSAAVARTIADRGALGASDLASALAWASSAAKDLTNPRLIVLGDGVVTLGPDSPPALRDAAQVLSKAGFTRADAVLFGGITDAGSMAALVTGALPRAGVVVDGTRGAEELSRRLLRHTLAPLPVSISDATWFWPRVVEGAQPGDYVMVHFVRPAKAPARAVRIGPHELAFEQTPAASAVLERMHALAKVEELERDSALDDAARRAQIVALSTKHRILSEPTAMLVLETEADFDRFKIDRKALVDVLGVRDGRVALTSVPRARGQGAGSSLPATNAWETSSLGRDGRSARGGFVHEEAGGAGGLGLAGVGSRAVPPSAPWSPPRSSAAQPKPQVRMGATMVSGRVPPEIIQREVRQAHGRLRTCYESALGRSATLAGRLSVRFKIGRDGVPFAVSSSSDDLDHAPLHACVAAVFRSLTFPKPSDVITVTYPVIFSTDGPGPSPAKLPLSLRRRLGADGVDSLPAATDHYEGRFAEVMDAVAEKDAAGAMQLAIAYRNQSPLEVLAYLSLGEAYELAGQKEAARRAYGSVLELWAYRVDMVRLAAARLERVGDPAALSLATQAYERAAEDRPDHPGGHRLLAMVRARRGQLRQAFDGLEAALGREYPANRFAGFTTVLRDDLASIGSAWAEREPALRQEIERRLSRLDRKIETTGSLRFVLHWETDASNVDLHVADASGAHAHAGRLTLPGGGRLIADVRDGYGPEAFHVAGTPPSQRYQLRVRYDRRGPMGIGTGKVQIVRHDGRGNLTFDERPFVLMKDGAVVDLGQVSGT